MPLDNQMTDCASASRTLSGGTVSFMQCLMSLRGRVRRWRDDSSGRKAELALRRGLERLPLRIEAGRESSAGLNDSTALSRIRQSRNSLRPSR